jgi:rod shape-determining protein MreD
VRGLRFIVGLLGTLTLHAVLNKFVPNTLVFFNPYVILIVYYAMGGYLTGAIVAGVIAGFVQDAFSLSIFGVSAFSLTICGYIVAYINSRLVLKGNLSFGACLAGSTLLNEIIVYVMTSFVVDQHVRFALNVVIAKPIVTTLFGMLLYQLLTLVLHEEPLEMTRRRRVW